MGSGPLVPLPGKTLPGPSFSWCSSVDSRVDLAYPGSGDDPQGSVAGYHGSLCSSQASSLPWELSFWGLPWWWRGEDGASFLFSWGCSFGPTVDRSSLKTEVWSAASERPIGTIGTRCPRSFPGFAPMPLPGQMPGPKQGGGISRWLPTMALSPKQGMGYPCRVIDCLLSLVDEGRVSRVEFVARGQNVGTQSAHDDGLRDRTTTESMKLEGNPRGGRNVVAGEVSLG